MYIDALHARMCVCVCVLAVCTYINKCVWFISLYKYVFDVCATARVKMKKNTNQQTQQLK